jgi:hypothetical protein
MRRLFLFRAPSTGSAGVVDARTFPRLADGGGIQPPRRRRSRTLLHRQRLLVAVVAVAVAGALTGGVLAYFTGTAAPGAAGAGQSTTVNQGPIPTPAASGNSVTLTWSATTLANGAAVDAYMVNRYDANTDALQVTGIGCNGTVTDLTCTEMNLPPGSWYYTITPLKGTYWQGPQSEPSGSIIIGAATLTLDQTTFTAPLPKTATGSLTGFAPNEGISYRLDDSPGTTLSGSPSTADGDGNADVSIEIPTGTADGPHTVYALGDGSPNPSVASAAIIVDATAPTVTASLSPAPNGAGWNNSAPVEVTLVADDGANGSGVDQVKYTTDGTDPTTSGTATVYSAPFNVSSTTAVKFFATDAAGNASTVQTQQVRIDTIAPANAVSLNVTSGNALLSGSTLFYRGVNAGAFTIANALTDNVGGSGPASTGYAALAEGSSGWSFTSSSVTSGPPYVSTAFSWNSGTSSSPTETLTGYDVADNFSSTTLTFSNDSTGPAGGSVDAAGLVGTGSRYSTSTALSIAFSAGTDAGGVGMATSGFQLKRASATLSSDGTGDGTCGSYGSFTQVGSNDPGSPFSDTVSDNHCVQYEYIVSDRLGNTTTYTSPDIKVQTTAPGSLTPALTVSNASGSTYVSGTTAYTNPQSGKSGSFKISGAASDSSSGIAKLSFPSLTGFTDGGGDDSSSPYDTTYHWSGSGATASGSKTVTAHDNATLTANATFTVTPDTTNPTNTASAKNADNSTYTAGTWTNQSVTVHYTCGDSGSGVASCPSDQSFTSDGVTTSTSGTATDNVGNQTTTSFGPIKVDKTNPNIAASAKKADNSTYTADTWTNQAVTVHYTCSDPTANGASSGIASCAADQVFSAEAITASTSGTGTDNAGNSANTSFGPIKIDKTKPQTTLTTSPSSPDGSNSWFKRSSVSFTLGAVDLPSGFSGVANSFYTVDGGGQQTYSGSVTINSQGDHTVTFWSVDNAGNVENTNTTHIKLDNVAPSTTIATTPASANGSNGWFVSPNSSVSFTLGGPADATSGLANRFYTVDGGSQQTYSGAVTVNTNGDHTIQYWSTDNAGNVESANTFHIKIDTVAPANVLSLTNQTTQAGPAGTTNPESGIIGSTLYYDGNLGPASFKIQNAATDAASGPASSTFAALAGTATGWTFTGSTVTTPSGGPFLSNLFTWADKTTTSPTETITATDAAGNTNAGTTLTFTNDQTPPTSAITFPVTGTHYTNTTWNAGTTGGACGTQKVCGTASDGGSGIAKVQVSIQATSGANSGKYWDGTGFNSASELLQAASVSGTNWSLTFPASNFSDADYTVIAYAVDNVGNFTSDTNTFDIDNVAPTSSIVATAPNAAGWNNANLTPSLSATDAVSGVTTIFWSYSGAQTNSGSHAGGSSFNLSQINVEGTTTVTYHAIDNAGNVEADKTYVVKLDKTPPTNSLSLVNQGTVGGSATSFLSGTKIFYNGSASSGRTFQIQNAVADTLAGPASSLFGALGGTSTGFTFATSTVSTPSGGPYVSNTFTWNNPTSSAPTEIVTGADVAGNTLAATTLTLTNDVTAPTTTATPTPAPNGNGWNNANVSVGLSATDGTASGVASITYSATGAQTISTTTVSGSSATVPTITTEGTTTISYSALDNVGNVETTKTQVVKIDKQNPDAPTLTTVPSVIKNGQALSVTSASDNGPSGVTSVSYYYCAGTSCTPGTLIGSGSTGPSYSFTWSSQPADGTYTIAAKTTDAAGNASALSATQTVTIENSLAPTALTVANKTGGTAGRPEQGDTITVTYSGPTAVNTICATWSGDNSAQSVTDASVTIANNGVSTKDGITASGITSATCGTVRFGTLNLNGTAYVTANTTFTNSTIDWDPSTNKLKITLGTLSSGTATTDGTNHAASYAADSGINGSSGVGISTTAVSGANTVNF